MITRLILEPGQIIRVTGPSRARVVSGQVLVLGAIFNPGDEFVISKYRSYAVKGLVESVLELDIGHGGSIENPLPGEEVIDQWVSEIDGILRKDCKKVVIIGPSDSGKTSIAALIANRGLLRGYNVGIIDADVGQADVGPPATVSASLATHPILWLRELRAQYLRFIGSITPQRYERRILAAVIDLRIVFSICLAIFNSFLLHSNSMYGIGISHSSVFRERETEFFSLGRTSPWAIRKPMVVFVSFCKNLGIPNRSIAPQIP